MAGVAVERRLSTRIASFFGTSQCPLFGPRRHTVFTVCRRGALYISHQTAAWTPDRDQTRLEVLAKQQQQQQQHSVAILAQAILAQGLCELERWQSLLLFPIRCGPW